MNFVNKYLNQHNEVEAKATNSYIGTTYDTFCTKSDLITTQTYILIAIKYYASLHYVLSFWFLGHDETKFSSKTSYYRNKISCRGCFKFDVQYWNIGNCKIYKVLKRRQN